MFLSVPFNPIILFSNQGHHVDRIRELFIGFCLTLGHPKHRRRFVDRAHHQILAFVKRGWNKEVFDSNYSRASHEGFVILKTASSFCSALESQLYESPALWEGGAGLGGLDHSCVGSSLIRTVPPKVTPGPLGQEGFSITTMAVGSQDSRTTLDGLPRLLLSYGVSSSVFVTFGSLYVAVWYWSSTPRSPVR
ncbi:hypothetical protein CRG98_040624 [Punica granatum]|uniref:Uncharacterized protein n=1 Tax=Punica granatum TaxID=22663 RepID=A0A2I0I4S8_PUNGR|nr:hypothetical protein CRG98_040624 [Punica granatum]